MIARHVIVPSLAGFMAGAVLVGGLALQPANDRRPREDRPQDRQPQDRPPRGPDEPDGPARDGPPRNGPPDGEGPGRDGQPMNREATVKRLEERLKTLEEQRERVTGLLDKLRRGEELEPLLPQIRDVMFAGVFGRAGGRDERNQIKQFFEKEDPKLAERMDTFITKHPLGGRILMNIAPKPDEVVRAKKDNPALFNLYRSQLSTGLDVAEHALEFGDMLRASKADTDEGKAKRATLREAVDKLFAVNAELRTHEIESLVKRVEALKARANETQVQRDAAIDAYVDRLARLVTEIRPRDQRQPGGGRRGPEDGGKPEPRPEGKPEGKPANGPPR